MTKEVLVSVKGTQLMGEENDTIEIITSGTCYEKNGKQYILFEGAIGDAGDVTRNTVKIEPDKVEVTKRGLVESHMTFERGKKNMANYVTPVGLIVLGLTTASLTVTENEKEIHIGIKYSLEMNGEYISDCSMEILAKAREKGGLHLT